MVAASRPRLRPHYRALVSPLSSRRLRKTEGGQREKIPRNDDKGETQITKDPQHSLPVRKRAATHQFEYLPSTSPESTSNNLAETMIGLGTSLSFVRIG